jgi:hypothetical protein
MLCPRPTRPTRPEAHSPQSLRLGRVRSGPPKLSSGATDDETRHEVGATRLSRVTHSHETRLSRVTHSHEKTGLVDVQ